MIQIMIKFVLLFLFIHSISNNITTNLQLCDYYSFQNCTGKINKCKQKKNYCLIKQKKKKRARKLSILPTRNMLGK